MQARDRYILEHPIYQGKNESIIYSMPTTPWGSSPTGVSVTIETTDGTDVSATHLTGSPSVSGDTITFPLLHSLVAGTKYVLRVAFTISGSDLETISHVYGQE